MTLISIKHRIGDSLMVILLALACMCIGCAYLSKDANKTRPLKKAQLSKKSTHFAHTIQWPGETLSIIAKWYTGNFRNWAALARANPNLDPDRVFTGNKILIPKDLLKTREPLPKEFVAKFSSPPKKNVPLSGHVRSVENEKEPELFGPKGYPRE